MIDHIKYVSMKNPTSEKILASRSKVVTENQDADKLRSSAIEKQLIELSDNVNKIKEKDATLREYIFARTKFRGKDFDFFFLIFMRFFATINFFPVRLQEKLASQRRDMV